MRRIMSSSRRLTNAARRTDDTTDDTARYMTYMRYTVHCDDFTPLSSPPQQVATSSNMSTRTLSRWILAPHIRGLRLRIGRPCTVHHRTHEQERGHGVRTHGSADRTMRDISQEKKSPKMVRACSSSLPLCDSWVSLSILCLRSCLLPCTRS